MEHAPIHRLVIGDRSARTFCGIEVVAYFPGTLTCLAAMDGVHGDHHIGCTQMNDEVTCEGCREKCR